VFYVPMEEVTSARAFGDMRSRFPYAQFMSSMISIICSTDETLIYYDHWEDSLDNNPLTSPGATTTVWGDNFDDNGKAPGFCNDALNAGDVVFLQNAVPTGTRPPLGAGDTHPWDGHDKIIAIKTVVVTRGTWQDKSGTCAGGW
jgi:hypothetical protein